MIPGEIRVIFLIQGIEQIKNEYNFYYLGIPTLGIIMEVRSHQNFFHKKMVTFR